MSDIVIDDDDDGGGLDVDVHDARNSAAVVAATCCLARRYDAKSSSPA
jgi:hypothetical protein